MDYSRMIDAGFAFAGNRRRLAIQFVWMAIAISLLLLPLVLIMPLAKQFLQVYALTGSVSQALSTTAPAQAIAVAGGAVMLLLALLLLLWLASVFVHAFFAHNALTNSSLKQSADAAKKNYLSALLAVIVIALVGIVQAIVFTPLKAIPFAGALFGLADFIVSVFFGLAFLFTIYAIMSRNANAFEGISESFGTFFKHPLETLATLVAAAVLSAVIAVLSLVPPLAAGIAWAAAGFSLNNAVLAVVALACAVAVLGFAYAQLFNAGCVANAFNQLSARPAPRKAVARKRRK
ncbi:MAG: hypothetical protein AB1626_05265 [Candidatus Micrarchaeota archaeon]